MKNKAVMKMAKMAGDSRTAMKMKAEDAAMKMKKQSAMKMKDPMDMKKDPMKMNKDSKTKKIKVKDPAAFTGPSKYFSHLKDVAKNRAKILKEKIKSKVNKGSAMKKRTDNIPSPRVQAPAEAKDRNHPKHKQWVEENLIKYGPGSNKPYNSYEDYLAKRDKSPKTMKKGAMKMAKKSPMKRDNFSGGKEAKKTRDSQAKRDFLKNWKTLSDEQKRKVPDPVVKLYGVTKPKNPAKGRLGGLDSMAQK